jgi:hypothetical protein
MNNNESFFYSTNVVFLILLLFIGMLILLRLGSLVGDKLRKPVDGKNDSINTTVVGSVLALFAFLLGFTFSQSGNRFETRRINNISEANAIGTAISRADLYQQPERDSFRKDFKQYVLARIHYFQVGNDLPFLHQADKEARYYSSRIWNRASTDAINAKTLFPGNLMLPSLNEMIDSANFNNYVEKLRVPDPIVFLLLSISLVCAFFIGYYTVNKDWFNRTMTIGFCLLSCLVIYTTLDLDSSRTGLIKHHLSLQAMTDLLDHFSKSSD